MTGVDPQKIEVRKYGHTVPLAEGPCFNCGRPVRFNLAAGIADHGDDGEPNDCRDPWPAASIERAEIDGAALEVAGTSASTNEACGGADGDRGARVDGSGVDASPAVVAISTALAARDKHVFVNVTTCACGFQPPMSGDWERHRMEAALAAVVPLIRAQTLREYADRWHYVDHSRWPMSTFGAAPTPYCACGKTWPEGGCTERRNLIAEAEPAEFDRLWAELENAPENPGTGQPAEGAAGEVGRG